MASVPATAEANSTASLAMPSMEAAVSLGNSAGLDPEALSQAHYNLGVALGYSGSYDAGIAELERGYALKAEQLYLGQVRTIRQFKDDDRRLAEQEAGAEDSY